MRPIIYLDKDIVKENPEANILLGAYGRLNPKVLQQRIGSSLPENEFIEKHLYGIFEFPRMKLNFRKSGKFANLESGSHEDNALVITWLLQAKDFDERGGLMVAEGCTLNYSERNHYNLVTFPSIAKAIAVNSSIQIDYLEDMKMMPGVIHMFDAGIQHLADKGNPEQSYLQDIAYNKKIAEDFFGIKI